MNRETLRNLAKNVICKKFKDRESELLDNIDVYLDGALKAENSSNEFQCFLQATVEAAKKINFGREMGQDSTLLNQEVKAIARCWEKNMSDLGIHQKRAHAIAKEFVHDLIDGIQ